MKKKTLSGCAIGLALMSSMYAQHSGVSSLQSPGSEHDRRGAVVSVKELQVPRKAAREFAAGSKLRASHLEKALAHFKKAIQACPAYTSAYVLLGLTLLDERQWDASEIALRQAIEIEPDSPEANTALGILLNRRGEFDKSEPALQKAVRLAPQSASAHYELGLSCWARGLFECANREAQISVDLNPNFAGSRVLLGSALLKNNNTTAAAEQFKRALLLDPNGSISHSVRVTLEKIGVAAHGPNGAVSQIHVSEDNTP